MHANEHKGQNEHMHANVNKKKQNRNSCRHQNEQKGTKVAKSKCKF